LAAVAAAADPEACLVLCCQRLLLAASPACMQPGAASVQQRIMFGCALTSGGALPPLHQSSDHTRLEALRSASAAAAASIAVPI
jgi:hypothetical protein